MSSHPVHCWFAPLVLLSQVMWVLQPHKWLQGRDGDEEGDGVVPIPIIFDALTSCFSKQGEAKLQGSYFALGRVFELGNSHLELGGREAKHFRNVKTRAVQK